ncbi:MAG: carboxypeptidase regulatory-like domain-containing protein [Pirellulaceae bacterium]
MRRSSLLLLPVVIVLTIGCGPKTGDTNAAKPAGQQADKPDAAPSSEAETETASANTASANTGSADLSGRITLMGEVPPPRKLSITKDVETCGAVDTVVDITGTDGGVADVVIEIKDVAGEDWTYNDPTDGYVMRQKDCQFKPSLLVIPNGKDIKVYNDDPVGHNVNTGDWNKMQPAGPDPIVRPVEGKAPTKIGCNIHSWMEAWIYPVSNPYFAVTDEQGNFKITGVPPGKYRVNIWHASLGRKNARLTLEAGKAAKLDHEFDVQ